MNKLLIYCLLILSQLVYAGDLASSFSVDPDKNIRVDITNHSPSSPILIKAYQIVTDHKLCVSNTSNWPLLPQQSIPFETLKIVDCLNLNKNYELIGICGNPEALAFLPDKGLIRKEIKLKISYMKGPSPLIESEPSFSLLFREN